MVQCEAFGELTATTHQSCSSWAKINLALSVSTYSRGFPGEKLLRRKLDQYCAICGGGEHLPPGEVDHALRQTYLAQPFILISSPCLLTIVRCRRVIISLEISSGSVEHDLVLECLISGAEGWVVDGEEGQLRGDYRIGVAFRHRIVSSCAMTERRSANHPEFGSHAGRPVGYDVDITCLIDCRSGGRGSRRLLNGWLHLILFYLLPETLNMLVIRGTGAFGLCRYSSAFRRPAFHWYTTKAHDPLRILFCGSDEFSIASLKALHDYHLKQPDRIATIDVVCRPGKKVGRGMKKIREGWCFQETSVVFCISDSSCLVPIKETASALSLPIHEIDTFTKWTVSISNYNISQANAHSSSLR